MTWKADFENELVMAKDARASGNEGKARVCARRAAGILIEEYLKDQGLPIPGPSAYNRLQFLITLPGLTQRAIEICEHLLLRVNEEFKLPIEADLISETYELADLLLGES
jgi:hypothetical protein